MNTLLQLNPEDKEPLGPPLCSKPPFNAQGRWASFLTGHFQKSAARPELCSPLRWERTLPSFLSEGFPAPEECTKLISDYCTTTPKIAIFIKLSWFNQANATYNCLLFLSIIKHVPMGVVGQGLAPHQGAGQLLGSSSHGQRALPWRWGPVALSPSSLPAILNPASR